LYLCQKGVRTAGKAGKADRSVRWPFRTTMSLLGMRCTMVTSKTGLSVTKIVAGVDIVVMKSSE
jgi:hypothetical protein